MLNKIIISLIILVGVFLGGFYLGKGQKEIEVITKEGETKTVYKDRIVTVIKTIKPDGTITETTKTEDKSGTIKEKKKDTATATRPSLSNYSAGLYIESSWDNLKPDYGVSLGRRLIGEVWLKSIIIPAEKQIALGVELSW